jgi:hypothetical protein
MPCAAALPEPRVELTPVGLCMISGRAAIRGRRVACDTVLHSCSNIDWWPMSSCSSDTFLGAAGGLNTRAPLSGAASWWSEIERCEVYALSRLALNIDPNTLPDFDDYASRSTIPKLGLGLWTARAILFRKRNFRTLTLFVQGFDVSSKC